MASDEKKHEQGKLGKIYVANVEAKAGEVAKSIIERLTTDTHLVEQSDYVLITHQKNGTKRHPKPPEH